MQERGGRSLPESVVLVGSEAEHGSKEKTPTFCAATSSRKVAKELSTASYHLSQLFFSEKSK